MERAASLVAGDESNNFPEGDTDVQDKVLELARSLSADVPRPSTFAEYTQALEAMKHQLALFLLRGDDSTSQPPQTSPDSPSKENSADALWAQVKDRTTPDNFLLEIPILEVGPPLLVHSLIFSTIEKFVRELEASHLPIPSAAKFQLVRRPPRGSRGSASLVSRCDRRRYYQPVPRRPAARRVST